MARSDPYTVDSPPLASPESPPPTIPESPPSAIPEPPPSAPLSPRAAVWAVVAFFMAEGVLRSGYFHFGARADGADPRYLDALLSELTGAGATAILFFALIVPACRRFPVEKGRWAAHLAVHAGVAVVFSVTKTLMMGASRAALWPLFGLGSYDYGALGYRITMEAANDVTGYAVMAFGVHVFFAWRDQKELELSQARLQARLNEARLTALQGRLQPHFLFNTLNTISSVLYEDPRKADDLISRLSDLLRASLDAPDRPLVSLEEELDLTRRYMELMEARFGDRLRYTVSVEDDARGAELPAFLIQPLVENAVQYAVAPRVQPTPVRVTVSRPEASVLRVDVEDDGPGIDGEPERVVGSGVGLANTRERLANLYGAAGSIHLVNRAQGGLRVRVELPWRDAAAAELTHACGARGPIPRSPIPRSPTPSGSWWSTTRPTAGRSCSATWTRSRASSGRERRRTDSPPWSSSRRSGPRWSSWTSRCRSSTGSTSWTPWISSPCPGSSS